MADTPEGFKRIHSQISEIKESLLDVRTLQTEQGTKLDEILNRLLVKSDQ